MALWRDWSSVMMEALWVEMVALPPARIVTAHNSQGIWKLLNAVKELANAGKISAIVWLYVHKRISRAADVQVRFC